MKLSVNGKSNDVNENTSIVMLLSQYKISGQMTIVEINQNVIPKEQWDTHVLEDGDQIEIVQLMGGG